MVGAELTPNERLLTISHDVRASLTHGITYGDFHCFVLFSVKCFPLALIFPPSLRTDF